MSEPHLPLFVFGTLRRGHANHHYLHGSFCRVLPARLKGFERIHPLMIARRPGGEVDGELYFLSPERYAATLRECDALEGIPPGERSGPHYARLLVTVQTSEGEFAAWAYVHPCATPSSTQPDDRR